MGRPSKISDEKQAAIVRSLEKGATIKASFLAAGVHESSYYRWMSKGKEEDAEPEYRQFRQAIKEAEAKAEIHHTDIIHLHAFKSWQASAWWLERRKASDYARQDKVDVTTKGKPLGIVWEIVDPNEDQTEAE